MPIELYNRDDTYNILALVFLPYLIFNVNSII